MGLTPNLDDYDRVRATFTWAAARAELEGLPDRRGLNIAHEAVDRHAAGPRGGHVAIHPAVPTVDADLIARCHQRRLAVNTWTCNDPARARQLAAWGVDGICTDIPDEILAALRDHPSPLG